MTRAFLLLGFGLWVFWNRLGIVRRMDAARVRGCRALGRAWFRLGSIIEQYVFIENQDFILLPDFGEQKKQGGHNRKDYALTLDMAKELAMVPRRSVPRVREQRCSSPN